MIHLHQIVKTFPDKTLFQDLDLVIKPDARIGLVGANGSGKTTLLRMIMGEETPESGTVQIGKRISIGYLPQEIKTTSNQMILNEVLGEFPEIDALEKQIEALNHRVADNPHDQEAMKQLGRLQEEFERLDGWTFESRAKKVLGGLGFSPEQMHTPLEQFSGGWRMRVALAKLLFRQPDILLLDEPTNHLDLSSLIWLETFLNNWSGALVLISHDRTFLDKTIDHIYEIQHQGIRVFAGNYSKFLEQKALLKEQHLASYRNQQKLIADTERFIERFRYKDSKASQVQSRVKMLEKLERIPAPEGEMSRIAVRIPQPDRAPRIIADFRKADKSYGELEVFKALNLQIERGQKIGLVGPNGAGKSTLLKMLAGVEPLTGGELRWGQGVERGYFAQHQFEALPMEATLFELISQANPKMTVTEVRSYLGSFLFSGDTIEKQIKVLSGGEVSRLALARMLVKPAHLILLDEPTNHLDMASRDVVQDAVANFAGSMVCISHDRYFLDAVTDLIIEVDQGKITSYPGNYAYYEWRKSNQEQDEEQTHTAPESEKVQPVSREEENYKTRKRDSNRLKKLPELLAACEKNIEAQDGLLANPVNASQYELIQDAMSRKEALEEEYLELLEEFETLSAKLA
jgi:ATP-binding cassette subfamily F protein 3